MEIAATLWIMKRCHKFNANNKNSHFFNSLLMPIAFSLVGSEFITLSTLLRFYIQSIHTTNVTGNALHDKRKQPPTYTHTDSGTPHTQTNSTHTHLLPNNHKYTNIAEYRGSRRGNTIVVRQLYWEVVSVHGHSGTAS